MARRNRIRLDHSRIAGIQFRDLPEFCRAELTAGPSSAFRRVEDWIPTHSWNGKLMMVGRDRSGTSLDLGRMAAALSGGFTTASLDEATPVAIHEATNTLNLLLAAYFGPEARWIYWSGCAASARDGLLAADRYPDDFDGILAGGLSEAAPPVASGPGKGSVGHNSPRPAAPAAARWCSTTRKPARRPPCCRCARTARFVWF